MKDFATLPNISGTYPDVEPVDNTGAGTDDGTPVIKQWVTEIFGVFQALLDKAGLSPSGIAESATTSQILNAIRMICMYPGTIFAWGGPQTDIYADLGIRGLLLNGQGVLCATYTDLVTATYCGDANNPSAPAYYKADNADGSSRNTSGAYFILPDVRGRFLRALDPTGLIDKDGGASRMQGGQQDYALFSHHHGTIVGAGYNMKGDWVTWGSGSYSSRMIRDDGGGSNAVTGYSNATVAKTSSYENRPYNTGVRYFIAF